MSNKIEFKRVNNDVNGNPRYVCHFLNLVCEKDCYNSVGEYIGVSDKYIIALKRAKRIGGKKYHNKQYGGGIIFQSYNIEDTEKRIVELLKEYE